MTSPLRIGIVGLGRLGQRHAQALAFSTRNCVLTAACSPVEAERTYASTELGIQQVYARFEDLLASPDVIVLTDVARLTQAESDRATQSRPKERIEIMGLSSQDHPKTVILLNAG